jgi:hypothetical protein
LLLIFHEAQEKLNTYSIDALWTSAVAFYDLGVIEIKKESDGCKEAHEEEQHVQLKRHLST